MDDFDKFIAWHRNHHHRIHIPLDIAMVAFVLALLIVLAIAVNWR